MGLILKQKITGPAAWTGQDLAGDTSWIHPLTADAIASIDAALAAVKAKGLKFPHFGKPDFPLDAQALKLPQHANELERALTVALLTVRAFSALLLLLLLTNVFSYCVMSLAASKRADELEKALKYTMCC